VPEGLDLSITLPSAEVIPCPSTSSRSRQSSGRYTQGKLTSRFIDRLVARGIYADWIMIDTIPVALSAEITEVGMKAVNERKIANPEQ
jgi:hypothetical protein